MFRNRGSLPNINIDAKGIGGYNAPFYRNGKFIIIRYDRNFVLIEMISVLILVFIALAIYLMSYKVTFYDPIASIKENFLKAQLISILISVILVGLVTFLTKSSREKLIRNLKIVTILSIIAIILTFGFKLNIDNKYNKKETFAKFYEEYEKKNEVAEKENKVSVGLTGLKISTKKEDYIEKSINAYTNFSVKVTLYLVIYVIIVIILFYLLYRLYTIQEKMQRLAKDDIVVYDEEENIKF